MEQVKQQKPMTIEQGSLEQIIASKTAKSLQTELKLSDAQVQKANLAFFQLFNDPKLNKATKISKLRYCYIVATFNYKNENAIAPIPYGDAIQSQLQYQAFLEDMDSTGHVLDKGVIPVYEGVDYKPFVNIDGYTEFKEIPEITLKNPFLTPKVLGYYAYAKLDNGKTITCVKSIEQIEQWGKKYSISYRSGNTSPWTTSFDKMAKKTVLKEVAREVLKIYPVDRLSKSLSFDQAVISDEGVTYKDNPETIEVEPETTTVKNTIDVSEETYGLTKEGVEELNKK